MSRKKIIIIGGGAAGFFCAANLDERKFEAIILEQNTDVLQKVKISGGGRCNVTHACFIPEDLVEYYPRGKKELRSVFTKFQPGDTMEWFTERNVPLKIESDNRIFPESNSSKTIIDCLKTEVFKRNFIIKNSQTVTDILQKEDQYCVITRTETFIADIIIFTPGSSPKSLKIIEKLGHSIVPQVPSLFTFNIKDKILEELPGISFPDATVTVPALKTQEQGALLITHWGISGPGVLKLSAKLARELFALNYKFQITANFIGIDKKAAFENFNQYREMHPKETVGACKIFNITNRFRLRVLQICNINPNKNLANLSGKEVDIFIETLCNRTMEVTGKSTYKDEFVTAGGVSLKEINFKNMSSKILHNFYFAGEVLDIDAVTGGFNFQACWSEGYLIAEDLNSKF